MVEFINFRDLEFDHAFIETTNHSGKTILRWAPIGMPRIPDKLTRCVFYLFEHDPVNSGTFCGPWGTGFIVARQSAILHSTFHFYGISNRHVVNPSSTIRINTINGGIRFIERDPSEWIWSTTDDLAATDITDEVLSADDHGDDIWCVSEHDFVDPEHYRMQVGIGDQTIMLGLFADHNGGSERNLPVGRFGNLAALPDESVPVRLSARDNYIRPAFLNDMRSRSGFSGSPVWTWHTPYDDTSTSHYSKTLFNKPRQKAILRLIGVHRGQFQEQAQVLGPNNAIGLKQDDNISIASSMTVVIPAWEISNLLNNRKFVDERNCRDARPDRIKRSNDYAALTHLQEGALTMMNFSFRLF